MVSAGYCQVQLNIVYGTCSLNKYVRRRGWPYIHTCRSCVHMARCLTDGASLPLSLDHALTEL